MNGLKDAQNKKIDKAHEIQNSIVTFQKKNKMERAKFSMYI